MKDFLCLWRWTECFLLPPWSRCLGYGKDLPCFRSSFWTQAPCLGTGLTWGQSCLCSATDSSNCPMWANIPGWHWPFPDFQGCVWAQWPPLDLAGAVGMCWEGEVPVRLFTPASISTLSCPLPAWDELVPASLWALCITAWILEMVQVTHKSKQTQKKLFLALENLFKVQKSHPVSLPCLHEKN